MLFNMLVESICYCISVPSVFVHNVVIREPCSGVCVVAPHE